MFKPKLSVLCWLTPLLRSLQLNLPSVCSMGGTFSVKLSSRCHPWLCMFCSCLRGFYAVPGTVSSGLGRSGSLSSLCNCGRQGAEQSSRAENHTNSFSQGWHCAPPAKEAEFSPQSGCLASQIPPWTLFIANLVSMTQFLFYFHATF